VAPIYRTSRAEIDLKHIIGIQAYSSGPTTQAKPVHAHAHDSEDGHDHSTHDERAPTHYELRGISSLQVECPVLSSSKLDALDAWIRSVLWEGMLPDAGDAGAQDSPEVLRCKGTFSNESGQQYVLQGVRSMYEITKTSEKETIGLPTPGKLVLIGKGLTDRVRNSLTAVLQ